MPGPQPPLNRKQRRDRKRRAVTYLLDGPPKTPVCGQAKAAARNRARAAASQEPKMPKNNAKEKRLARERQAATGRPYTVCLAEVRTEHAGRRTEAGPARETP